MHDNREFNAAVRRAAGKAPPEAEPETPPEPDPPPEPVRGVRGVQVHKEGFNEALRRLRGFAQ